MLLATFAGLGAWFVVPESWHIVPHPVYYTLAAAAAAFIVVAAVDSRRIKLGE